LVVAVALPMSRTGQAQRKMLVWPFTKPSECKSFMMGSSEGTFSPTSRLMFAADCVAGESANIVGVSWRRRNENDPWHR
jgi:hypothetical protein